MDDKGAVHIVVVAGFNYSAPKDNPREFDQRALHRIGYWLENNPKRRETVVFHYLSVGYGVVARSIPIDPSFTVAQFVAADKSVAERRGSGRRSFWADIQRSPFGPVTSDNYGKRRQGDKYPAFHLTAASARRRPMSLLDVYGYVATMEKGSVAELSVFSHSGSGGPLLVNSYEGETVFVYRGRGIVPAKYSDLLVRDPDDFDSRGLKDFYAPVGFKIAEDENSGTTEPQYLKPEVGYVEAFLWWQGVVYGGSEDKEIGKKISRHWHVQKCVEAFRRDAFIWVWGCLGVTEVETLLKDVIKSPEFRAYRPTLALRGEVYGIELPAQVTLEHKFDIDSAYRLQKGFSLNKDGEPLAMEKIVTALRILHLKTYAVMARFAFGVRCIQAFIGTSADLEPRKRRRFPLLNVEEGDLESVRFYDKVVRISRYSDDPLKNVHIYSEEFPYADYRLKGR